MGVLFESHDNDFTKYLLFVVETLIENVSKYEYGILIQWLLTKEASDSISEAFAATIYASCFLSIEHLRGHYKRQKSHFTLDFWRDYVGKIKIAELKDIPADYCNGEAVWWSGDDIFII